MTPALGVLASLQRKAKSSASNHHCRAFPELRRPALPSGALRSSNIRIRSQTHSTLESNVKTSGACLRKTVRAALGQLLDLGRDVLDLVKVDRIDADVRVVALDLGLKVVEAPLGVVDRDEVRSAAHRRPDAAQQADDAGAPDTDDVALFDARVLDLVERRDERIGQVERVFIVDPVRNLDAVRFAVRDTDVLGLAAGESAREVADDAGVSVSNEGRYRLTTQESASPESILPFKKLTCSRAYHLQAYEGSQYV